MVAMRESGWELGGIFQGRRVRGIVYPGRSERSHWRGQVVLPAVD